MSTIIIQTKEDGRRTVTIKCCHLCLCYAENTVRALASRVPWESSWVYFVWNSGFVLLWLTDGPQRSHLLLCHFGIAFHTFQHFWASTANFCPPTAERRHGGRRRCAQSLLASLKPDPAGPCLRCCARTMTAKWKQTEPKTEGRGGVFWISTFNLFFCLYVPTTAHITCTMET